MESNPLLLGIIPSNTVVLTIQPGPATPKFLAAPQLSTPGQVVQVSPRIQGSRTQTYSQYSSTAHPARSGYPKTPGCTTTVDPRSSHSRQPQNTWQNDPARQTVDNGDYFGASLEKISRRWYCTTTYHYTVIIIQPNLDQTQYQVECSFYSKVWELHVYYDGPIL
jgi:hypothetical protein